MIDQMYKANSIKKYLDDLAAKLAAPGGGSAAALAAATGASLISMVVNFTIGKSKYTQYAKALKKTLNKSERLRRDLLNLVDLDVIAYRSNSLKDAINVPLMVCRLCFEAIKLCPPLIRKGNINLISDVAVAAVLLEAGFAAANFNVEINLGFLKNRRICRKIRKELRRKEKLIKRIRLKTEVEVGEIIRR